MIKSVSLNDFINFSEHLNNSAVTMINLGSGKWNSVFFCQCLQSRTISSPVVIEGPLMPNGEKGVKVSGLSSQQNYTMSNNFAILSYPCSQSNFPRLYVDGSEATLKSSEVIELVSFDDQSLVQTTISGITYYTIPKEYLNYYSDQGLLVNVCSLLKVGSILCLSYAFEHLRFVVVEITTNEVILQRSDNHINISFNPDGPFPKVQVLNCSGYPDVGEYVFTPNGNNFTVQYKCSTNNAIHEYCFANSNTLLDLVEKDNIIFRNIEFCDNGVDDITIGSLNHEQSESGVTNAIILKGCVGICFDNCDFRHLMGYAIGTDKSLERCKRCTEIVISSCHVQDTMGGGFHLNCSDNCSVEGCLIENFGQIMCASCGILLREGVSNRFISNTITDGYYTGISVGWRWTWGYLDNPGYGPTQNNHIRGNHIHHCIKGHLLWDGGGIYVLGGTEGTVIEDNVVHDLDDCRETGASAFYLDQASSQINVRHNLCWNCRISFHLHYGYKNYVYGNVFAYPVDYSVWFDNDTHQSNTALYTAFYSYGNIYIQPGGNNVIFAMVNNVNIFLEDEPAFIFDSDMIDSSGLSLTYLRYKIGMNGSNYLTSDNLNAIIDVQVPNSNDPQRMIAINRVNVSCADVLFEDTLNAQGQTVKSYRGDISDFLNFSSPNGSVYGWPSSLITLFTSLDNLGNPLPISHDFILYPPISGNIGLPSTLCVQVTMRGSVNIRLSMDCMCISAGVPIYVGANSTIALSNGVPYLLAVSNVNTSVVLTIDDVSKIQIFDTTFCGNSIYGNTFNHAELSVGDLPFLFAASQLFIRYSLHCIPKYMKEINFYGFSQLTYLYIGDSSTLSGGNTSSTNELESILLPEAQAPLLVDVNLSIGILPVSAAGLSSCQNLYLYDLTSFEKLRHLGTSQLGIVALRKLHSYTTDEDDAPVLARIVRSCHNLLEVRLLSSFRDAFEAQDLTGVDSTIIHYD